MSKEGDFVEDTEINLNYVRHLPVHVRSDCYQDIYCLRVACSNLFSSLIKLMLINMNIRPHRRFDMINLY